MTILRALTSPAFCCALLAGALSGCSVIPSPFTDEEIQAQAAADSQSLFVDQEPLTGPVSLAEAIARALRYNLDYRLRLRQEQLARTELDLSRYEMLPDLVGSIGYEGRDNFSGASSRSLLSGQQSLEPSTSSDRDVNTADLRLSWNVLDFGLSYVRARQAADQLLIAEQQRRLVVNQIVEEVRGTYWRAVSNDRLTKRINRLRRKVDRALRQSRKVETSALENPLAALTYQRELLDSKQELEQLQRSLVTAKIRLGALMNISPGTDFDLVLDHPTKSRPALGMTPEGMERLALENRPELHEIRYQERINAEETKAALLRLLPGIELFSSANDSSNSFLYNSSWLGWGAQVSWNLLNIFKYPATERTIEARGEVLRAQRLALAMAVLTQLHVGIAEFKQSSASHRIAGEYLDTQRRILAQIRAGARTGSVREQTLIREELNTLLAEADSDVAYANLENVRARTLASIGEDPVPVTGDGQSLSEFTETVRHHLKRH